MSSKMEVDSNKDEDLTYSPSSLSRISVHPLAIVNMSDQYTRITCGGTPLDRNAPVVGLLFGTCKVEEETNKDSDGNSDDEKTKRKKLHLEILDANDIPTDLSEAATGQVLLHQAVFSNHEVVGWYRVAAATSSPNSTTTTTTDMDIGNNNDSILQPTENDLQLTQQLQDHYIKATKSDSLTALSNKPPRAFVFGLLQVQNSNNNADDQQQEAVEVPLNLYELANVGDNNTVLIGLDHWTLQTSEPERIAVERVIREQPTELNNGNNNKSKKKNKKLAADAAGGSGLASAEEDGKEEQQEDTATSAYVTYMSTVQSSLEAMKDRIQILIHFIQQTKSGEIPPNFSLLRHVHALVLQLGPLANGSSAGATVDDSILLSHLAAVAKAVHSVQSYTDKFRTLHEHRAMPPGIGGGHHREGRGRY